MAKFNFFIKKCTAPDFEGKPVKYSYNTGQTILEVAGHTFSIVFEKEISDFTYKVGNSNILFILTKTN
jgi:hypothetical protein